MGSAPSADFFQPLKADDPAVVGGYRLAAVLGSGGMGKVYLSYTPGGRPIAIKVIRPEFSEDPEFRRRFQQEVRAAERVQGLYTAPVIDSDTEGAQPWLATAYVPGPSLAHAVARHGALPVRSVLLLTVGVAEALHVIHGAGIVHRDLKPANVLLASDGPRVIDFGIARAADSTALTSTGVSVGTPAFMAPEQASAGTVTPATDVFALGQIAAFTAIGASVFGDGPSHAVLYRIVHEDPDLSALPEQLRPVVTRCLSRDPADRPALSEIIELCNAASEAPLRQGEDWLPRAVAGSITERLRLPAPAPTPAPAPIPTEVSPQPPAQAPVPAAPGYTPTGVAAAAPTQTAPVHGAPGAVPPGYRTPPPYAQPSYPQPSYAPGHGTPPPFHTQPFVPGPSGPPRPKRTGLIVIGAVAAAVVGLVVLGSMLPDGSGKGGGDKASGASQQRPDPQPVSYQGIEVPQNHQLMFADNPPRPAEEPTGAGVLYGHADLFYYRDTLFGDEKFGTANGKLVVLNNSEKGSLETCRAVTRFTEKVGLDQLTDGSQVCVLSKAGHITLATFRGGSGGKGETRFITVDLTVWRNAEAAAKN
ncbi:serine/threonine protein kinase [Streptomyces nojiriensis]|uniref:Serine/threonine protein kinase n=1 Tax=Streptomyces nojiriensis TaxID=66374 RepID=A0ABQ3SNJ9_9ACTN|nr:protein kinase [Streptomyces nojiriensis]QTI43179.1 Serine/threonine-protein kinase AfsK [Streptomyces nojiriensis]GGS31382.1 serine/threonine protein kinase [Streptomyces nojiriensis]GHI69622.1 serine/threonine protein kinase [Streptomyces nojiriensis]